MLDSETATSIVMTDLGASEDSVVGVRISGVPMVVGKVEFRLRFERIYGSQLASRNASQRTDYVGC